VERGPDQLAVLRDAGVVDAGAYGLTVIVAGCLAALRGDGVVAELEHQEAGERSLHLPQHESSSYRYCTNFAVSGEGLNAGSFVPRLEELGDSVLVVGDEQTIRVHVHTDEPEAAVAVFEAVGEVSRFDVADMDEQVAERDARIGGDGDRVARATCGVVAVASGEGLCTLFDELGVLVVDGGSTMNPSTYELLAGIHRAPADQVLVLPNSPNVIMAAERAAELSEKPARVVPTTAPQEGLAALLAFDPNMPAAENATAVGDAAAALRLGGVAPAARDDAQGRFRAGDAVGYSDGELVAFGGPAETLASTLAAVANGAELLTCVAGDSPPLSREQVAAAVPDGVELEYHDGGQPAWWWLLCAE
jgi:fatty acid kinase